MKALFVIGVLAAATVMSACGKKEEPMQQTPVIVVPQQPAPAPVIVPTPPAPAPAPSGDTTIVTPSAESDTTMPAEKKK